MCARKIDCVSGFDLSGSLRRVRRRADLSQRELASAAGLSASAVAHAEAGTRDLPVSAFARAAALAGLRLALVDSDGQEVGAMTANSVRDLGGRRFPAHLDTLPSKERWWRYEHRWDRPRPSFTFDRDRPGRDRLRGEEGTPEDHHEARPRERRPSRAEETRRAYLAGAFRTLDVDFQCTCPAECDELDHGERPVHADGCPCLCDVG